MRKGLSERGYIIASGSIREKAQGLSPGKSRIAMLLLWTGTLPSNSSFLTLKNCLTVPRQARHSKILRSQICFTCRRTGSHGCALGSCTGYLPAGMPWPAAADCCAGCSPGTVQCAWIDSAPESLSRVADAPALWGRPLWQLWWPPSRGARCPGTP